MEEQIGGEVRNKKSLNLTDADEGVQKIDHNGGAGLGDLFTAEYFKEPNSGLDTYAPFDLNVGAFDIHGGENFSGVTGETVEELGAGENAQMSSDFLESTPVNDGGGGIETAKKASTVIGNSGLDDLLSDIGNLDFGSDGGEQVADEVKKEDTNGSDGFVGPGIRIKTRPSILCNGYNHGCAPRRIRMRHKVHLQAAADESEGQEFGRDTNRLDYFSGTFIDVFGNDDLNGIASHGGGARDRGVVIAPRQEQETAVAGGDIRIRRRAVRFSANNSDEGLAQRLEQDRGNGGGGRGHGIVGGSRLEEESGRATAGARGGDRTPEVPVGISANIGSDGGEAMVKRLKQEGTTVAVPVAMVVVAAVTMMVMLIAVVVLVLLTVKIEVRW